MLTEWSDQYCRSITVSRRLTQTETENLKDVHCRIFSLLMLMCLSRNDLDINTLRLKTNSWPGYSWAWTEVDGVHILLCMKWSILYVLCAFVTLQTSGVHPLLFLGIHLCAACSRPIRLVHKSLLPVAWSRQANIATLLIKKTKPATAYSKNVKLSKVYKSKLGWWKILKQQIYRSKGRSDRRE